MFPDRLLEPVWPADLKLKTCLTGDTLYFLVGYRKTVHRFGQAIEGAGNASGAGAVAQCTRWVIGSYGERTT